jgi:hypothetical protein
MWSGDDSISPPARGVHACAPEEATMFVPRHGDDAAATGPRLREITIQYTLKRGVDGRPIRLGSPVTHSWAAAQLLAQIQAKTI